MRLSITVRSSLPTPSSLISLTAWLSPVPSSITPTTVYQESCSGTSRPSTKTLTSKEELLRVTLAAAQQHTWSSPCILDRSPRPARISFTIRTVCEAGLPCLPRARVNWTHGYQEQEAHLGRKRGLLPRARAGAVDQAQPLAAHAAVHGYRVLFCGLDGRGQFLLRPGRQADGAQRKSAERGQAPGGHGDRGLRRGERYSGCREEHRAGGGARIQDSDRLPLRDRLLLLSPAGDRRQPSHPVHAGTPQRLKEFGRTRLEGQAGDRGDRYLPRYYPERARERRPSSRREHTRSQHGRDARVHA